MLRNSKLGWRPHLEAPRERRGHHDRSDPSAGHTNICPPTLLHRDPRGHRGEPGVICLIFLTLPALTNKYHLAPYYGYLCIFSYFLIDNIFQEVNDNICTFCNKLGKSNRQSLGGKKILLKS